MTGHDYGFALIEFITIVRQNGRQHGILQALCTTDLANPSLSSKRAKNEYVLTLPSKAALYGEISVLPLPWGPGNPGMGFEIFAPLPIFVSSIH